MFFISSKYSLGLRPKTNPMAVWSEETMQDTITINILCSGTGLTRTDLDHFITCLRCLLSSVCVHMSFVQISNVWCLCLCAAGWLSLVSQVAGVVGRADVLAGLFFIGSILSYRKASHSSGLGNNVHININQIYTWQYHNIPKVDRSKEAITIGTIVSTWIHFRVLTYSHVHAQRKQRIFI